jgi:hypothetical protein
LTYRGVNAAVEAFFATLKRELEWIYQQRTWPTRAALTDALIDYIRASTTRYASKNDSATRAP